MFAIISPKRLDLMDRNLGLKLPPLKGGIPLGRNGDFRLHG
jgi:hypothetical protein